MTDLEEKQEPITGTTEGTEPKEDDKPMGIGCAAGGGIGVAIICGIILAVIANMSDSFSLRWTLGGAIIAGLTVSVCVPKYSIAGAIIGAIAGAAVMITFVIGIAIGDHYIDDTEEVFLFIICPIFGAVAGFNFIKDKESNKDL